MIVKNKDLDLIKKCLEAILCFKEYRNIDVLMDDIDEMKELDLNSLLNKLIIGEE